METFKRLIFFLIIISIIAIYPFNKAIAFVRDFSINLGLWDYGFKSIRNENSKSIDKIIIPVVNGNINFSNENGFQYTFGYKYNYILQSTAYSGFSIIKKNLKIGSGISLGFYNELPIKLLPGAYGLVETTPIKTIKISFYGYSSIFLKRLFSLESITTDFDQNILNFGLYYQTDYVSVGLKYNSMYLYKSISSSSYIKNTFHDYQFEIKTDLKNSVINSNTIIGGNDSLYKSPSINNRLIQIYIDETIIISLKSLDINLGSKINILSFALKDIKSTSPPKLPYFNIHGGISYHFGK